ncbi:cyclin-A2 [Protopterus annectens]|uniref:cyclin-A2 n=1 Tax=Protopterus annectens TaxID=7888 RepID=UPI001CF9487B|nr:cyclin-A2 [Protopterus annectens]
MHRSHDGGAARAVNRENVLPAASQASRKYQEENQENVNPHLKASAAQHRTVLGVLNNNQGNKTRSQRPSKQGSTAQGFIIHDENHGWTETAKIAGKQPAFTIHVDEPDGRSEPVTKKTIEEPLLTAAVANLDVRRPLASLEISMDISFESPGLMELSEIEVDERKVNANEVPDYAHDIYSYLREMEVKCKPKAGYMKKQQDITNSMRAILVDWLVEVGEEYKLSTETLYLSVNYIDRFLSSMSVLRGKLQLVGTAAMFVASKFEEIYPPEVAEFVYITDDTYTKKQVLRMEHLILKVLSFDLAAPTAHQFLTQYVMHCKVHPRVQSLAMFLGELSLIDADPFLKYLPSVIAASAFLLANYTVTQEVWPEVLEKLSGYTLESLTPCLTDLHQTYLSARQHAQQAVQEKYKSGKLHGVSSINPPDVLAFL